MEVDKVRVMVRVRPFSRRDIALSPDEYAASIMSMNGEGKVDLLDQDREVERQFSFHETFWSIPEEQRQYTSAPFASQEDVFNKTGAVAVEEALKGYNTCIFAYGQTGSGKTHTMFGSKYNPGIVPMVLDSLFESIAKAEQGQWEYSVEVSFMEIYNETVKDLFEENHRVKSKPVYRVKNSPGKGVQVEGLTKLALMSAGDVKDAMSRGVESRSMRDARMGSTSSRSHMILQIDLTATNPVLKKQRHSRINLVGLAGSERIKMSCSGVTLHHAHRESMLTWILSESLGGNSKTMMIATVSPAESNREDTCNTLRFLSKFKAIVNTPKVNEVTL